MKIFKDGRRVFYVLAILSVALPGIYVSFHIIQSGSDSVTLTLDDAFGLFLILYYILLVIISVFLFVNWLTKRIREQISLKEEKIKTEILFLKAEVNPHFFFNMLNNLYAMVEKDTALAKEVILGLSDLMHYSIYEGKNEEVTLEKEIEFLNNFIRLQKVRYHRDIDVRFAVEVDDLDLKVTPLLYIILVENAFKHGVESIPKNAYINMSLKAIGNKIAFQIENNFDIEKKTKSGIGLKNLMRRLELLYPESSKLDIKVEQDVYYSKLELSV